MGLGLKGRLGTLQDGARRLLRVGDYWFWIEGGSLPGDIPIAPLVHPLRYDILVRRDLFLLYRDGRERFAADPEAFLAAARDHDYRRWVEKVMIGRFHPRAAADPRAREAIFRRRVLESAALYESIDRRGFDPGRPIVPFTGLEILPTETGKLTGARYHMGDGCHRLACLMALGHRELPRSWVRVKCFRRLRPLDNTSLLAPHLPIRWPAEFVDPARSPGSDQP